MLAQIIFFLFLSPSPPCVPTAGHGCRVLFLHLSNCVLYDGTKSMEGGKKKEGVACDYSDRSCLAADATVLGETTRDATVWKQGQVFF